MPTDVAYSPFTERAALCSQFNFLVCEATTFSTALSFFNPLIAGVTDCKAGVLCFLCGEYRGSLRGGEQHPAHCFRGVGGLCLKGRELGRLEAGFTHTGGNVLAVKLSTDAVVSGAAVWLLVWAGHEITKLVIFDVMSSFAPGPSEHVSPNVS